jgi:hypothetical protein
LLEQLLHLNHLLELHLLFFSFRLNKLRLPLCLAKLRHTRHRRVLKT